MIINKQESLEHFEFPNNLPKTFKSNAFYKSKLHEAV